MADRFPLIYNANAGQIQELQVNDNLDLTSSSIVNAISVAATSFTGTNLNFTGVSTLRNTIIGSATTELIVNGDARITGILTIGTSSITLNGNNNNITIGTGVTINSSGSSSFSNGITVSGAITATSFVGDGSGLTGAGSTVSDDTTTNALFYPLFTQTTSGTVTNSKVSTTKLTFNPSTGTLDSITLDANNLISTNINSIGVSTLTTLLSTNLQPTNLNASGVSTLTNATGTNLNFTGISTVTTENVTNLIPTRINSSGVSTLTTLNSTVATLTNAGGTNLNFTGIGTISNALLNSTGVLVTGIVTARSAATQDSISLNGRAGGSSSFNLSLTPATLGASRTVTFQDITGTVYVSGGTDVTLADGGTSASLTATNGGIVYSTASAMAITAAGTSGQILQSTGAGAPVWIANGIGIATAGNSNVGTGATRVDFRGSGISTVTVGSGIATVNISGGGGLTISDDTTTNATRYVVFDDATSGTVSAANVSSSKLTFNPSSGTLSATVFTSLSDENQKENIVGINTAISKLNQLRGVKFNWKDDKKQSYGVIAQEVEKVLPELVVDGDSKTVNYSGLIAVLIEAVKEQQNEISNLKERIEKLESQ